MDLSGLLCGCWRAWRLQCKFGFLWSLQFDFSSVFQCIIFEFRQNFFNLPHIINCP
jgi:hypothetical protein